MSDSFRAIRLFKTDAGQETRFVDLTEADLGEGDVTVRVEYSTVNYKDGLALTGKAPVVRRFPMIPGIDFAGTVAQSAHAGWKPGDDRARALALQERAVEHWKSSQDLGWAKHNSLYNRAVRDVKPDAVCTPFEHAGHVLDQRRRARICNRLPFLAIPGVDIPIRPQRRADDLLQLRADVGGYGNSLRGHLQRGRCRALRTRLTQRGCGQHRKAAKSQDNAERTRRLLHRSSLQFDRDFFK